MKNNALLTLLVSAAMAAASCNTPATSSTTAAAEPSQSFAVETFTTDSGNTVEIGLIKHASLSVSYQGYQIMIDPVAMDSTINYSAMPKANLILITHEHGDHLSEAAIAQLSTDTTRILFTQKCFDQTMNGEVINNGQLDTLSYGIVVEAVPAYNTTEDRQQFHPQGVGNGYVLNIDGLRIYVAGDTEYISEMANLKDIDVAFLPVNQPYTMTIEQAASAARTIMPKVLFPYHYSQTNVEELKEQLADTEIDIRIRKM